MPKITQKTSKETNNRNDNSNVQDVGVCMLELTWNHISLAGAPENSTTISKIVQILDERVEDLEKATAKTCKKTLSGRGQTSEFDKTIN